MIEGRQPGRSSRLPHEPDRSKGWNPRWLAYAFATGAEDPIAAQARDDQLHGSALAPFGKWLDEQRVEFTRRGLGPGANDFTVWLLRTHVSWDAAADWAVNTPAPLGSGRPGDPLTLRCTAKVFPLREIKARDCGAPMKHMTKRGPRCAAHHRPRRPTT